MEPSFLLHLGGSTHLTPGGTIVMQVPEGVPVYALPSALHLDAMRVAQALRELTDTQIPEEELLEKWVAAGQEDAAVAALFEAAEVATIIGGVLLSVSQPLPLVLAVIGGVIASAFGGSDGYDAETSTAIEKLRWHVQGQAEIAQADVLIGMRAEIQGKYETLRGQFNELAHKPTSVARLATFDDMRATLDSISTQLVRIRDEDWLVTYDPEDFQARFGLSSVLVRVKDDGSEEPVPPQRAGLTMFDYRLGVPMLLYTGMAYAGMLQLAIPWFRSDGTFRERLRAFAAALDGFVARMQRECFSRTEHTAQSLFKHEVFPIGLYFGSPLGIGFGPTGDVRTYPVGAFDLVRHSDSYIAQRYVSALSSGGDTGSIGTFDYTWPPPASLADVFGQLVYYPEGAEAANEQSGADYARLVVTSGAVHLLTTSALLRHLSSPPTTSETVTGTPTGSRVADSESPTTATSPLIFPNRRVTAPATLRTYRAAGRVRAITQRPGHRPALQYRVVLRTIDALYGREAWRNQGYRGRVWNAELEPIPSDTMNKRLRTDFAQHLVLSQVVLYEGASPPSRLSLASREPVTMPAHTFDWYVPVSQSVWGRPSDRMMELVRADPATPGSQSIHLTTWADAPALQLDPGAGAMPGQATMSSYGQLTRGTLSNAPDAMELESAIVSGLAEVDLSAAERRHVRREEVTLDWRLEWEDGDLEATLKGRPENRSCQVYVVIEEAVQSGEPDGQVRWLHTPIAAELVNQVTLVPRSFFTEEGEALDSARTLWYDLLRRFSEVAEVGPEDPVVRAIRESRSTLSESTSTASLASALEVQFAAIREHRPDVWEQVRGAAGAE